MVAAMEMTLGAARALVSLVAVATLLGGVLADAVVPATAAQHLRNPRWPPHAKFHNGQTIALSALLGALALVLAWLPAGDRGVQLQMAVVVASLYWLSMLAAAALPGTRWVDLEFERPDRPAPRLAPQLRLGLALLALLAAAEVLQLV
jgi:hypothetical protein